MSATADAVRRACIMAELDDEIGCEPEPIEEFFMVADLLNCLRQDDDPCTCRTPVPVKAVTGLIAPMCARCYGTLKDRILAGTKVSQFGNRW